MQLGSIRPIQECCRWKYKLTGVVLINLNLFVLLKFFKHAYIQMDWRTPSIDRVSTAIH